MRKGWGLGGRGAPIRNSQQLLGFSLRMTPQTTPQTTTNNPLDGSLALITGASAGIGAAVARAFAASGAHLQLAARRAEPLESLAAELRLAHGVEVETRVLDVRQREAVESWVDELAAGERIPRILVNNAGLSRGVEPIHQGRIDGWEEMIDTNVKGLLYMSRAILPHMVALGRGHVIHLGSVAGDVVYPGGNVYNATKFAVKALTDGMNLDLAGTSIRISSVDPGLVETEFSEVRFHGDVDRARKVYEGMTPLRAEDVAEVIRYVASAPPHVNLFRTVLYPTDQRNAYVVHRRPPTP
jgi:3-hydroxy acid dehydrogenase / malonic semialdehyde reductase